MSNSQRFAVTPSARVASDSLAFEIAASLNEVSVSRPASGVSKKPLSAVAPSDAPRGGGAETKLYQVPRELIEIARANARSRKHVGTLTPIAPRPDAEIEAGAKAYAALISESPAPPSDLRVTGEARVSEPSLIQSQLSEPSISETPQSDIVPVAGAPEALALGSTAPDAAAPASAVAPVFPVDRLRVGLYACVLVALGYCAQLVDWPW